MSEFLNEKGYTLTGARVTNLFAKVSSRSVQPFTNVNHANKLTRGKYYFYRMKVLTCSSKITAPIYQMQFLLFISECWVHLHF